MSIKTSDGTIYEKDIEDAMWNGVEDLWVYGWLNRQLILTNGERIDLLGWSVIGDGTHHILELVEIKSVDIKFRHLTQINGYEYWLANLIHRLGFIEVFINKTIVTTSTEIQPKIMSSACNSGIQIRTVDYSETNGICISNPLCFTDKYYLKASHLKEEWVRTGRYDNLINFMLPHQPDFIQREYRVK